MRREAAGDKNGGWDRMSSGESVLKVCLPPPPAETGREPLTSPHEPRQSQTRVKFPQKTATDVPNNYHNLSKRLKIGDL